MEHAPPPLWQPTPQQVARTGLDAFRRTVERNCAVSLPDSRALHAWSVAHPGTFWAEVWEQLGVVGERGQGPDLVDSGALDQAVFLPDARLNFAENLLAGADTRPGSAIVAYDETGARREISWRQLLSDAAAFAATLRDLGVVPGDRVAAWMPNVPETVVAFLGSAMVGAVFSSASPDFGTAGVLDRFGQIEPTVLVACEEYSYGGRTFPRGAELQQVMAGLPSLRAVFVVGRGDDGAPSAEVPGALPWPRALAQRETVPQWERLPFNHPLVVLYSSGTTGKPKAIVHRAGGVLLKHLVEHQLHCDVRAGDTVMYYTTCGWMMWNWLVSALASRASLVLFEGSPVSPGPSVLFDIAQRERVTLFGTSAKYLDAVASAGLRPRDTHDLAALRTVTSTGSPLSPERFAWVYEAVADDVHLASISGGTDIVGCFVAGDPTLPVWAGEIQGPALGLDIDVLDSAARSLQDSPGVRGELVCRNPFPSMPLGLWGDDGGSRYRSTYFEQIPGVWTQGDFASFTEHQGVVIHGRSDATLNVGGVRIGTAEIYRAVERLPQVHECLAVAQEWQGDTRTVLFVVTADDVELDDDLRDAIRSTLRVNCSPRHVPARIVSVEDLPRTRSGKLAELAVRDVVAGRAVGNAEALANPEVLDLFRDRAELQV